MPQPQTWKCIQTLKHKDLVYHLVFSSDGQSIASVYRRRNPKSISLWSIRTGECKKIFTDEDDTNSIGDIALSPDGQTIITNGKETGQIKLWSVQKGQKREEASGHSKGVTSYVFSPDGQTLASVGKDGIIKLWSVQVEGFILWSATKLQLRKTLTGHSDEVKYIVFSPDGQTLASGSTDKSIKIWSVQTGQILQNITAADYSGGLGSQKSLAFSPDRETLISVNSSPSNRSDSINLCIKWWSVRTGSLLQTIPFSVRASIWSIALCPDGEILALGTLEPTNTIKLLSVRTGQEIQNLMGHSSTVSTVAFSPDGQTLASGSGDKTIKIWRRN
ncbi:WD40 repeat domain-containing protein [Kamptonema animale CS-326]|jgi:WD40 repeat protein|uniref:WD40 repeat domain-containing protein n=1 Tax=Kamptonema animale TaxID=92934 RepID=UPI00232D4725|nr:WD40 repeat domain-containing protein [Kamptonema animale]MDB9511696.1 WD40 repeat domain-containing protein [Kamptonema animale CS-326]